MYVTDWLRFGLLPPKQGKVFLYFISSCSRHMCRFWWCMGCTWARTHRMIRWGEQRWQVLDFRFHREELSWSVDWTLLRRCWCTCSRVRWDLTAWWSGSKTKPVQSAALSPGSTHQFPIFVRKFERFETEKSTRRAELPRVLIHPGRAERGNTPLSHMSSCKHQDCIYRSMLELFVMLHFTKLANEPQNCQFNPPVNVLRHICNCVPVNDWRIQKKRFRII